MKLPSYVAVTTAHNEQSSIGKVITSVLDQSHPPKYYIVVDDNSTDSTAEKIQQHPVVYNQIQKKPLPVRSYNMLRGLYTGIYRATELFPSWEFLLKVDGDIILPKNYVARILDIIKSKRIGIASGVPYKETLWKGHPSDGARIYRRRCWEEIGGLDPVIGWDTHAVLKANMHGWFTRAFKEIQYKELRTSKRQSLKEWIQTGYNRYYLGFPLYHTLGSSIRYFNEKPYFIASTTMTLSHILALLTRKRKLRDETYDYMKKYAIWEFLTRIGEREYL